MELTKADRIILALDQLVTVELNDFTVKIHDAEIEFHKDGVNIKVASYSLQQEVVEVLRDYLNSSSNIAATVPDCRYSVNNYFPTIS